MICRLIILDLACIVKDLRRAVDALCSLPMVLFFRQRFLFASLMYMLLVRFQILFWLASIQSPLGVTVQYPAIEVATRADCSSPGRRERRGAKSSSLTSAWSTTVNPKKPHSGLMKGEKEEERSQMLTETFGDTRKLVQVVSGLP